MADDKTYVVFDEANGLVVALKERYPYDLQNVRAEEIVVFAITDEPPQSKDWLAKISLAKGVHKAHIEHLRSRVKYYIEVYKEEWESWSNPMRQAIFYHELLHVPPDGVSGLVKHDIEDFSPLVKAFGPHYLESASLPDMLTGPPIKFDRILIDRLLNQKKKFDEDDEKPKPPPTMPPPMVDLK